MTSLKSKISDYIKNKVKILQKFAGRKWYPAFISFLACLDNFIIVLPTDGILISSSILNPKKWFNLALFVAAGSTIGAIMLALFVDTYGIHFIREHYSSLETSKSWIMTNQFFQDYGMFVVFIVAVTPLMQQPAVILASLANVSLVQLAVVIFVGRFIKFLVMSYIGSHAPNLLKKICGVQSEI